MVYHSDSYDKRKQRAIESELKRSLDEIEKLKKTIEVKYYCLEDATQAALAVNQKKSALHEFQAHIVAIQSYKRGRPPKDGSRATQEYYQLELSIQERADKLQQLKERSGCFVILTNVEEEKLDSRSLLKTYKGQYGIESDFAFLKDPMIVNDLFLKKSERIEALGMILVLALMVYRLMERQMRLYLEEEQALLPGWAKRPTDRPTSFMVSTVFLEILVGKDNKGRAYLLRPLKDRQHLFTLFSKLRQGFTKKIVIDSTLLIKKPAKRIYRRWCRVMVRNMGHNVSYSSLIHLAKKDTPMLDKRAPTACGTQTDLLRPLP